MIDYKLSENIDFVEFFLQILSTSEQKWSKSPEISLQTN